MNSKQLATLVVLAALLGGGGWLLYRNQKASWTAAPEGVGKKLLENLPINDVAHIVIKEDTNEVNLVRKDDVWRVRERQDYPANFPQIKEFILKARDLKAVQIETIGRSQWARLQLDPRGQGTNAALTVDFKGAGDKTLGSLFLGKKHLKKSGQPSPLSEGDEGWPDGRYVKVRADSDQVAVISDPLDTIEPKPEQWLDKDFVRVEKARSVEVVFPVATKSWKLTRETEAGDWKLAGATTNEPLDSSKIAAMSNPLSAPSFTDVSPGDALGGTNPPTRIAIETFDGFHYTVKVGQKTNDDYLVTMTVTAQFAKERTPGKDEKPEDKAKLDKEFKDRQQKLEDKLKQEQSFEKWTYLVSGWTIDPLLKERSELLAEKKEEPKIDGNASTNRMDKFDEPRLENPPLPAVGPK